MYFHTKKEAKPINTKQQTIRPARNSNHFQVNMEDFNGLYFESKAVKNGKLNRDREKKTCRRSHQREEQNTKGKSHRPSRRWGWPL